MTNVSLCYTPVTLVMPYVTDLRPESARETPPRPGDTSNPAFFAAATALGTAEVVLAPKAKDSLGRKLNRMIPLIRTEFALVIASELLPGSRELTNMVHVFDLDDGYLTALSFSSLASSDRKIVDYCWSLHAKHWHLEFRRDYWSYVIKREQLGLEKDTSTSMDDGSEVSYGTGAELAYPLQFRKPVFQANFIPDAHSPQSTLSILKES